MSPQPSGLLCRDSSDVFVYKPTSTDILRHDYRHAFACVFIGMQLTTKRPRLNKAGILLKPSAKHFDFPILWNLAEGGVLELFGVSNGVAELAVFVEAAGEEVVEQASAYLLELCNYHLCLSNCLIRRLQDSNNPLAVLGSWPRNHKTPHLLIV